ncbi:MAG TPA: FecR domain-containing protein [Paludibacter sp.]|nr:FecR domain-containing protein [Paludibacter sp.]
MLGFGIEDTRISFLFKKYLNGTCSKNEAQEIVGIFEDSGNDISLMNEARNQWLTINPENKEDLNTIENHFIMDRILDRLHHRIRLNEEESLLKHSMNKKFFTLFSKVAAILILPLLVYSIYVTSQKSKTGTGSNQVEWQTIKTLAGMQNDFLLPDGSHIWLNSGSVFKYPNSFAKNNRQVELLGEAFFDIKVDTSHPFLVKAGKMNIEVKGTRFNVINYPDEAVTELILESGSVRLFSGNFEDRKTIVTINPGERAVLENKKNYLSVCKVDIEKYLAWKEGILIFRDDQMEEVVKKLNRWFNVEIILQSSELKDYVYTATYKDETLYQILGLLKASAPIDYKIFERIKLNDNSYSKRKIVITKRN